MNQTAESATATNSLPSDDWVTASRMELLHKKLTDFRAPGQRPETLVVVPCFNSEKWIEACLQSLAANDEPHDVLLVDNGSRPIEPFVSPRPNLAILRAEGIGLVGALNAAAVFALESGYAYYARQDTDDLSRSDRLRLQRSRAESTGADLVVCPACVVDEQGETLWRQDLSGVMRDPSIVLRLRNPFVHSSYFLRTSVFVKVGAYDRRFRHAEDFELLQRIVRHGRIASTDEVLVAYTVHSGSLLGQSNASAIATIRVLWTYFDPINAFSYLGLARALLALIVPRSARLWVRTMAARRSERVRWPRPA
jgi:GT2 family glycosyltransferase